MHLALSIFLRGYERRVQSHRPFLSGSNHNFSKVNKSTGEEKRWDEESVSLFVIERLEIDTFVIVLSLLGLPSTFTSSDSLVHAVSSHTYEK